MKFKSRKRSFYNYGFTIVVIIIFNTLLLLLFIGNKATNNILDISKKVINNVILDRINNSINNNLLTKYNINDLIIMNYNNNDIYSIDYRLNNTYELLLDIKDQLMFNNNISVFNYDYYFHGNSLYLKIPFYNYLDNIFINNISPKVISKITINKVVTGNVKTVVNTYGINSLKVDLYANIKIISSINVPFLSEDIVNDYDILIASKIVNGKIPDYYNGNYKSQTDVFNLSN